MLLTIAERQAPYDYRMVAATIRTAGIADIIVAAVAFPKGIR